jgi:hypothetical protein
MRGWLRFVLVATVTIVLVAPMAAYGQQGTERPMKAKFIGTASWEWPGEWPSDCMIATTVTRATGQATHMGLTVLLSTHCPAQPTYLDDGRITLTAADGDMLYGTYDYNPAPGAQYPTITFAGGTGRFAGASGSATMTYKVVQQFIPGCNPVPNPFPCFDFSVPWPWSATLEGTISY